MKIIIYLLKNLKNFEMEKEKADMHYLLSLIAH